MTVLNIQQIKQYLPHRFPFLLVDAVDEVVIGDHIRARKAVTGNESVFNGHFPDNPVVPGVLQIEAMGQAGALLAILSGAELDANKSMYVTSINDCKFRRPVVPGDMMNLSAKVLKHKMGLWKLECAVHVNGELASEAVITAMSGPKPSNAPLPEGFPKPLFNP